eukprot:TRINITY_DN5597_c1_g1_i1.p1 TRINITY_DN5597_c1_g1~~TRINITY_DN5597_c1_g1_i1.p1  ORF type:complete len:330 (-),score=43.95 TRINITY_DN5597_c1_g1_i1:273-1211(-)
MAGASLSLRCPLPLAPSSSGIYIRSDSGRLLDSSLFVQGGRPLPSISQGIVSGLRICHGNVRPRHEVSARRPLERKYRPLKCMAEDLTPDNVTVLVAGGGGVGMDVLVQLSKAGGWVTGLQRGEKFRSEIEGLGAMLALGDLMKPATIDKALRSNSFDAVICTAGGGLTDIKVDSEGAINLMEATKKAGIKRFVLVSSIGAGNSAAAIPEQEMKILGPVLAEKAKAEEHLKASGLTYTIIRPGGLLAGAATGTGLLTEDTTVCGAITRGEVASLLLRCLFDRRSEGKVLSAIDAEKRMPSTATSYIVEFEVE